MAMPAVRIPRPVGTTSFGESSLGAGAPEVPRRARRRGRRTGQCPGAPHVTRRTAVRNNIVSEKGDIDMSHLEQHSLLKCPHEVQSQGCGTAPGHQRLGGGGVIWLAGGPAGGPPPSGADF